MFIEDGFNNSYEYKGITLRRAKMKDNYYFIKASGEALTLNIMQEKDLDLLGLPYLTYMYKKSLVDNDFQAYWQYINYILYVSIPDSIVVLNEDSLLVYLKTERFSEFKEEYDICYSKIEAFSENGIGDIEDVLMAKSRLSELEKIIFDKKSFNAKEFDEIRNILCRINGFDNTQYDPDWEKILIEAKARKDSISSEEELSLTDLINTLAFYLKKMPDELKEMDFFTFNHYIKLMGDFEEYKINKTAELQGTQFKEKIKHWFSHYRPVGKYDDVVSTNDITKHID